jgi:hypothetical protein
MRLERRGDGRRKAVAVDGERATRRHLVRVALAHDEGAKPPHLLMQKADRVGLGVVGAERVRADELGKPAGLVRLRRAQGPHLVQHRRHAGLGDLPGGLGAGEATADDMNGLQLCHGLRYRERRSGIKRA